MAYFSKDAEIDVAERTMGEEGEERLKEEGEKRERGEEEGTRGEEGSEKG